MRGIRTQIFEASCGGKFVQQYLPPQQICLINIP